MVSLVQSFFVRVSLLLCALTVLTSGLLQAADGDTIRVRTVEFSDRGPKQAGTYVFPSGDKSYRKILMNYKLKCPDDRPCGEWDYLMYVYLYHPSGRMDSTLMPGPNFTVNGSTTASFSYFSEAKGWKYAPRFDKYLRIDQTIREGNKNKNGQTIDTIGSLLTAENSSRPLNTSVSGSKSQYLWRASELAAANVLAGNITAMRLYVQSPMARIDRLVVRMKNTAATELSAAAVDQSGFTTVVDRSVTTPQSGGDFQLLFTYPFVWDGTSNVIVEISHNQAPPAQDVVISAVPTSYSSALEQVVSGVGNYFAQFDGQDYIVTSGKAAIQTGTVEARFMAADTSGQHYILSNDRDAGEDYPGYHLYLNGGKLNAAIWRQSDNKIMTISGGTVVPGRWYHAAMTFTGTALILYLDGVEVARSTTTPTTIKEPAYNLMIGVLAFEAPTYYRHKGGIADVRVWNTPLDAATIRAWQYRQSALASHPNYSNLIAWYPLNGKEGLRVQDLRGTAHGAFMAGKGNWRPLRGIDYFTDVAVGTKRPWTMFEQAEYTSRIDSVLVVDSVLADPVTIIRYSDFSDPGRAVDTVVRWGSYYRYTYDTQGRVTDSALVKGDATLTLQYHPYYSKPFEVIERYELMRYITPYGNGLNLGDGFTWTMDVTDFAPVLRDSVRIEAYNPQESLELTFDMIEGPPVRNVIDLTPLWDGNPRFGDNPSIESFLVPRTYPVPAEAGGAKLRVIQTGHQFGGNDENCAEFCDKIQYVKVDGTQRYERHVWRDNCDYNPVYPQGGTWVYDRSNWCPGAEVTPFDYELTPYIKPGKDAVIDVDMEPYTYTGNPGNWPNYVFTGTLFTYGKINAKIDASIEHIVRPTTEDIYRRQNPICLRPEIVIRNNGSNALTSLEIEYGVRGGGKTTFMWSGTIPPLGEQTVMLLPYNDWDKATEEHLFEVWLKNPNGGTDEYAVDNYAYSHFEPVPVYYSDLEIRLRTNKFAADQYEMTLRNAAGDVIVSRSNLSDNTQYVDSLQLPEGCYEFRLVNKIGYGLDFWAIRSQLGTGSLSFSSLGKSIKSFGADFGGEIYHQFRVGPMPTVVASDDSLLFGDVLIDTEKEMTIEVSPDNAEGLVVERATVVLPNRGFTLVSSEPSLANGAVKLAQGEKLKFTVAFKPTKEALYMASLNIVTNDLRNGSISVPLRGNGRTQVSVGELNDALSKLYLFVAPNAFSDESLVSFGVATAAPTAAKVTLVNSLGSEVAVLFDGVSTGDVQTAALSAKNLAAGVYYVVLHSAGATTSVPVTIVK